MEAVSVITNITALFSSILQGVGYIQLVRGFKDDLKIYQLKLDLIRLRISRWGQASGLCPNEPDSTGDIAATGGMANLAIQDQAELIEDLLERIKYVLEKSKRESQKMAPKTIDNESFPLDADDNLMPTRFKRLQLKIRGLIQKRYNQAEDHLKGAKWVLYKKDQCESLTTQLTELIGQLEQLSSPEEKLQELSGEECKDMGDSLRTLLEVVGMVDPHLETAATQRLEADKVARGVSVSAVTNNGLQVGVNYGEFKGTTLGTNNTITHQWK